MLSYLNQSSPITLLPHDMSQHQQHHRSQHQRQRSSSSSSSATAIKLEDDVGISTQQYENPFVYDQNIWGGGVALPRTMPLLNATYHPTSLDNATFVGQTSTAPMTSAQFSISDSHLAWQSAGISRPVSEHDPSSSNPEFETAADTDKDKDDEEKPKRRRASRYLNASPSAIARRRERNRKSQRDYRQRKELRIQELEGQLMDAQQREQTLSQAYIALQSEYNRLLREKTLSPEASGSIGSPHSNSFMDELPPLDFGPEQSSSQYHHDSEGAYPSI